MIANDDSLLNVKYNYPNTTEVPTMKMCSPGYFEILRCDSKYNNGSYHNGECMKYVSADVIYGSDDDKYCRNFEAKTINYVREDPNGLSKLKFFYKINTTEAEENNLGVALLSISFTLPPKDSQPSVEMDEAIKLKLKLQGNFVPSIVNMVTLIKFRTKTYKSILNKDWSAIIGLKPNYHSSRSIECQVNYFPFNQNPYDMPPETNGYFSVAPGDFIVEETTEKRTNTILDSYASAGGVFGFIWAGLIFLFGSSRLDTWGFARKVAASNKLKEVPRKIRRQREKDIDPNILKKYLVPDPYDEV